MIRRTLAVVAGILAMSVLTIVPALAQQSPTIPDTIPTTTTTTGATSTTTSTSTTSTSVLGESATSEPPETTETTAGTDVVDDEVTAIPANPTVDEPEVAGDVVTRNVVARPLPRTGGEIGGTALLGGALTLGGIVLAFGARRRRTSFEGA